MSKNIICKRTVSIRLADGNTLQLNPNTKVIDDKHLDHFYIKALIKDGLIVVLGANKPADKAPADDGDGKVTKEQLEAMTYAQLVAFAKGQGFEIPANTKKQDIISAILDESTGE